jgi:hypothetical protein
LALNQGSTLGAKISCEIAAEFDGIPASTESRYCDDAVLMYLQALAWGEKSKGTASTALDA